jgi:uncharacterized protein YfdQ (DUF2303 family)
MSEVEAISKMVTGAALVPSLLTDNWGRQHALVPVGNGGFRREEITPKGAIKIDPAFIDQIVNIDQTQSLVDYVNRFKTADTVIFADLEELAIAAVIDYHKADSAGPGLGEHHAVLSLKHSVEWETWAGISGRMYDQKSFARMIDINSDDIAQPTGAQLLEMVMDVEMATTVSVARRLESSGSDRGSISANRNTTGTKLPPLFMLSIPVFTGEPKVDVRAMTRDSQDGNTGKVSLGLELVRTKIIIETELARIARGIAEATSVPVMLGSLKNQ